MFLIGCSLSEEQNAFTTGKGYASLTPAGTEEEVVSEPETLYILTGYDTAKKEVYAKESTTLRTMNYTYTDSTYFCNKYGDLTTIASFEPGDVITTVTTGSERTLDSLSQSSSVWEREDITDFTVDKDRDRITFGGSNYRYNENILVFENGERISFSAISEGDTLTVIGRDKEIIAIRITSGEGTLFLANTSLFEGGWLNLDNSTYLVITSSMQIPVGEGTHTITVANDGYGDSTEFTVERGKSVIVDLDSLKGEGPKYAEISFDVAVEGTQVYIDGTLVPEGESASVKYGTHLLQAKADGYSTWTRRLVVNSAKAIIQIDVSSDSETTSSSTSAESETSTESTDTGETTVEGALDSTSDETDVNDLYLDTLSGLMETLIGTDDE